LRLLIPVAREGFLKDKCSPRGKKFEHRCFRPNQFYHRAGLISLYYSECVSNKHSIVRSAGP